MRHITLSYQLKNGHRGTLDLIARGTCAAVIQAMDLFGASLHRCSARVAA